MMLHGGRGFNHAATLAGQNPLAQLLGVGFSTHLQHHQCVSSSALKVPVVQNTVAHRHQGWATSSPWDAGQGTLDRAWLERKLDNRRGRRRGSGCGRGSGDNRNDMA